MKLRHIPSTVIICLIKTIRPFLGPSQCKFSISCTQYAELQLKNKALLIACYRILTRVVSCNPFFNMG